MLIQTIVTNDFARLVKHLASHHKTLSKIMKITYLDLIEQSCEFPQKGFALDGHELLFHNISIKALIEKYGTPFKLFYLPVIRDQIDAVRNWFAEAMERHDYQGNYHFCYCTKCNHFQHAVETATEHGAHLETSSAFDIDLIYNLLAEGKIDKSRTILHNGYKTNAYLEKIVQLQEDGFYNSVVILDSIRELKRLKRIKRTKTIRVGIRMAINEDAQSAYYTSRLGIPSKDIIPFFKREIQADPTIELKMLHFFVDSGIKDSLYYWGEFHRALQLYLTLRKQVPELTAFNLGGGFPIRNQLQFQYDYAAIIDKIVETIADACEEESVPTPHIFTEFGKYTVGEAGAIIFEVLEQKKQNDTETWYIIDNSLMNTIPDAWSIYEKFILLPVNKWNNAYQRVNIGGISCDHSDYYNSEDLNQEIRLPVDLAEENEPLYLGFFHTGAYQDSISGYGGIKHCLIPAPKHVILDRNEAGELIDYVYREEQSVEEMLRILGYS